MITLAKLAAVGTLAALSGLGIGVALSSGPEADGTEPRGPSHAADMMGSGMGGMRGMGSMPGMSGMDEMSRDFDSAAMQGSMPMASASMGEMHAAMQAMHEAMPRSLHEACDQMAGGPLFRAENENSSADGG